MKQYSFLIESIQQSVSNNISNNLVYHGSNKKLDVIKGSYTNKWTNDQELMQYDKLYLNSLTEYYNCYINNLKQLKLDFQL